MKEGDSNMSKYTRLVHNIDYVEKLSRRTGRTTATCKAAKEIGATVLTFNEKDAKRIREEHGVEAFSVAKNVEGMEHRPILVDPTTLVTVAAQLDECVRQLEKTTEQLEMAEARFTEAREKLEAVKRAVR